MKKREKEKECVRERGRVEQRDIYRERVRERESNKKTELRDREN